MSGDFLIRQMMSNKRKMTDDPLAIEMRAAAAARLVALRRLAGLSQTQVARLIEIDQTVWSRWELGNRMPDPVTMVRFCAIFKTTLNYIYLGWAADTHPDLERRCISCSTNARSTALMRVW
jgi:transcriptional regulator with XRE-family HTH domain